MLNIKLQETLNKKWENCWPVSDLRPLSLLDLLSYLFFIKKADDLELIHQQIKISGIDDFIYSPEIEAFTWSNLQNQSAKDIHHLFTKEHGLVDLMNHYSKINSSYSDYFKATLLIEPTPKLLWNAIEIVNIIETSDRVTRADIVEYLFAKSNVNGKNDQSFLPEHILNLIISLAEPAPHDIIFDPAAGNGNLLLSAFKFVQSKNDSLIIPHTSEIKLSGFEPDGVHLRIAAMNLSVHGMTESNIRLTPSEETPKEKSTLIISSLPILDETEAIPEKNTNILAERESVILNDIIECLSKNGRSVVLVRQDLLQSGEEINVNTRKKLIEQNNLEGVITLPTKYDSFYSGAAILVFDKSKPSSEDVWFHKWSNSKKKNKEFSLNAESKNSDFEEVSHILKKWKTRYDPTSFSSANSFFISTNYLRSNNYNLSFNDYKLVGHHPVEPAQGILLGDGTETVIAAKKENLHEFFESSTSLPVKEQKRKLSPILLVLLILICAAFAAFWVYSKDIKKSFSQNLINPVSTVSISNSSETISPESASNKLVSIKVKSAKETGKGSGPGSKKYTVINKAWFHYEPDSNKIKHFYLTPRKGLIVISNAEESGFAYVVYTNNKGESTHGWINKKDLQPVD